MQKLPKLVKLKSCKLIYEQQKFSSKIFLNPNEGFPTLEAEKTWIMTANKLKKNGKNYQRNAETLDVKISITSRNYTITYFQTLEEVCRLFRLEKR